MTTLATLCLFHVCSQTEIKTPIRIPAKGLLDPEENTKSDLAGSEKELCCDCPKTEEEKTEVNDDRLFRNLFENFLHNTIFLPRYGQSRSLSSPPRSSSHKEAKPCLKCATGRQPLCESDRDPRVGGASLLFVPSCTRGDSLSAIQSLLSALVAFRRRSNSGAGRWEGGKRAGQTDEGDTQRGFGGGGASRLQFRQDKQTQERRD